MAAAGRRVRPPRTAGDLVRGIGALLMLAVLLAGIPAGLLAVAGSPPLPATLPSLDDVLGAITRPDDGTLLVATLTWIGWIGWATLAVSIIVEIPAAARGVRAPHLPALGPQQRLAAGLVAAAALLFTGGTASLAAEPQPAHADPAPNASATARLDETPQPPDSDEHVEPPVHIVERGDTLWDIAEHHLGNGLRYPDLYEASRHNTQPDGRRLTDPDLIHPDWEITIPREERAASSDEPAADPEPDDGMGADDRDRRSTPSDLTAQTNLAPAGSVPADPTITSTVVPSPVDTDHVRAPDVLPTEASASYDVLDVDEEDSSSLDPCTVGGIGAALAGGLLFYLGTQRARQHRHRKPGQRIALPADGGARMEDELRSVHDPVTLDRVNRALRTITARCAMAGTRLPAVRFARLIHGQLELHLAEPAELPAPFLPTVSPTLWVLDPDGHILDSDEADDYPAPYPSLVTIGHDFDGGLVLVDLEHVGALAINGDETVVAEMLAAIAAELATSLWSNDVRVSIVGAAPELADVLNSGRIRHLDKAHLDRLLIDMSNRVAADRAALAEVQVPSLSVARATGVAEGAWSPEILLITQPMTDSERGRLIHLLHTNPRAAIGVVTTAGPPLTEWAIHLHSEVAGHAVLDPVGLAVTPQRVGPRDHTKMVDLFAATRAEETTAPPPWRVSSTAEPTPADITNETASPPRDEPSMSSSGGANATSWTPVADPTVATSEETSAPLVAVLGPVEVKYAPQLPEPTKRAQLTALAAFLAMHPGSSREAVDEAMWPGRRVSTATRNTAMAKLRDWLGTDPDGSDYLPRATTDGYRLHPGIKTDWHMFRELLPSGPATAPSANLVAALDLVRDQPFKGVNPRRYIWAERIQQEMIAAIGDVADELARRALREGDHRLALKAVMTGLAAEPGSEQLWRQRLRAHHAAGDRIALERAADQLTALADELGGELEDETLELLRQLLSHTSPGQPSSRGEPR